MSRFTNNALLGGGVRVRVRNEQKRTIKNQAFDGNCGHLSNSSLYLEEFKVMIEHSCTCFLLQRVTPSQLFNVYLLYVGCKMIRLTSLVSIIKITRCVWCLMSSHVPVSLCVLHMRVGRILVQCMYQCSLKPRPSTLQEERGVWWI